MPETSEVAFEALYLRLRQEGFRTGVDRQLRMQELLDRLECEPTDLKTVLCPLFATNPTQQAVFYRVFDEVFPALGAATPAPAQLSAAQALQPAALVAGAGTMGDKSLRWLTRALWLLPIAVFLGGAILFRAFHHPVAQPPPPPVILTPPTEAPVTNLGQPVPFGPNDTRTLDLAVPKGVPVIHPEAKRIAFEWSAIFTPLLVFGAFAVYRHLRRRIGADREAKLQEPHFWPLQLEAIGSRIFPIEELRELARRMRQREDAAESTLDIPATISATIRGYGFPNFRYRPIRRPPEYVVLIEQVSKADHFAAMVTDLVRILQADGVLLKRYYFEGDPRRLFTDTGEQIQLEDLAGRTTGFRLLLFGQSGCLFHPVSGKLEAWSASLFERYKLKTILLPDKPRPKRVSRLEDSGFAVVPADSAGLRLALDFFESGGVPAGKSFPEFHPLEEPLSEESLDQNPKMGPRELWLAACAVYPELNWNLTLRLASAVDPRLLREVDASRMARMPWLRSGEIPSDWRERLTEWIPDPMRLPIRESLFALLNTQAVPGDTFAWEDWQHTLRAFRPPAASWWDRIRGLVLAAPQTLAHESARDLTCLRFLDRRPKSRFTLPERLRLLVFEQGLRLLGTRTMTWLPPALASVLLLVAVFQPWKIHEEDIRNMEGTVVDDAGQLYPHAQVNHTTATMGDFRVSIPGDLLPITTSRPYWPQEIRMVSGGKVQVVVGKKHPQQGPLKILGVDPVRNGENVQTLVDYTGPVIVARAACGNIQASNLHVDASAEVISLPMRLDSRLPHDCAVAVVGPDGRTATMRFTVPAVASVPTPANRPGSTATSTTSVSPPAGAPAPTAPLRLLALYKLDTGGSDSTGVSGPFALLNTTFRDGALYLNGAYDGGSKDAYRAVAPVPQIDYRSLTVALDFKAETFDSTKSVILYGGTDYRWWGLNWKGGVLGVSLNNGDFQQVYPGANLTPRKWQNAICSLDLTQGVVRTVLDGRALPEVHLPQGFKLKVPAPGTTSSNSPPFNFDQDKVFTFTNYSNGTDFQGYAANLRVYSRALSAPELQSLYASIVGQSPAARQATQSGAVAPPANAKPQIVKFEAQPARVGANGEVLLNWDVTGAATLKMSNGTSNWDPNTGTRGETGSFVIHPASTTTYTLSFQDPALSSISRSVTVTVDPSSSPAPRSLPNQTPVTVTFTNATGQPVETFWMDLDGKEKGYGAIAPGANRAQPTSVASIWRFRQNGQLVGEYTVPGVNPAAQSKPAAPQYTIRTAAPVAAFQLGPVGGKGGSVFQYPAAAIKSVHIVVGGSIDYIGFIPMADAEKGFGSLTKAHSQGLKFDLNPGEEITGLGVSSGLLVDRIKFYTNQRESQWLGGSGGGPEQVLKIPPGGHFAGFVGRSGDSLDAIGLLYTGAPPASAK